MTKICIVISIYRVCVGVGANRSNVAGSVVALMNTYLFLVKTFCIFPIFFNCHVWPCLCRITSGWGVRWGDGHVFRGAGRLYHGTFKFIGKVPAGMVVFSFVLLSNVITGTRGSTNSCSTNADTLSAITSRVTGCIPVVIGLYCTVTNIITVINTVSMCVTVGGRRRSIGGGVVVIIKTYVFLVTTTGTLPLFFNVTTWASEVDVGDGSRHCPSCPLFGKLRQPLRFLNVRNQCVC